MIWNNVYTAFFKLTTLINESINLKASTVSCLLRSTEWEGGGLLCCVLNVLSPAVESILSAAPLAQGKAIAVQNTEQAQGINTTDCF